MLHKFKIGNANLAYNFGDADKVQAYENALKTVEVAESNVPKDLHGSELLRYRCNVLRAMFDDIFGKGTANKIFGSSYDVSVHINAFVQLVAASKDAVDSIVDEADKALQNISAAKK